MWALCNTIMLPARKVRRHTRRVGHKGGREFAAAHFCGEDMFADKGSSGNVGFLSVGVFFSFADLQTGVIEKSFPRLPLAVGRR